MPVRARVIAAVGAVAATALVFVAGVLLRGRKVRRFEYYAQSMSESDFAALGAHDGWQTRVVEVAPSVRVRGLVHAPTGAGAPWVLFFPGNSERLLQEAQQFLDRLRSGRDLGVVVYAYRGFDGSSGTPGKEAILRDASTLYDRLRTLEPIGSAKLHVIGFSLGSAVAASVTAKAKAKGPGAPASVTFLAPLSEIDVAGSSLFSRVIPDRYETLSFLDDVGAPALVIAAGADDALGVEPAHVVCDRLGARANYLELPGVAHLGVLRDARTIEAIGALID